MSQLTDLQQYFKRHKSITQERARIELGIARLASRIGELEQGGMRFLHKPIYVPTRRGRPARVVEYVLIEAIKT